MVHSVKIYEVLEWRVQSKGKINHEEKLSLMDANWMGRDGDALWDGWC